MPDQNEQLEVQQSEMTEQLELAPEHEKKDIDPLEVSSMGYGLYFPVFKNLVNNKLSGNSAKRILIALFANKLEKAKVNLKLEEEIQVLQIANKLFEDLFVLHLGAALEAHNKREELIAKNKENEAQNGSTDSSSTSEGTSSNNVKAST